VSWRDGGVVVLEILATVLAGIGIGLSLGAPPGPVNAIIASQTVTRSWRAGFLVGVGATTADTIFLAIAFLARTAVAGIGPYVPFIALLGAGVMVYFAWGAVRSWRRAQEILESKPDEHAKSYMTGLSVNITSPYPIPLVVDGGARPHQPAGPRRLGGILCGSPPVDHGLPARPAGGPTAHRAHVPGGPRVLDRVSVGLRRVARLVGADGLGLSGP